MAGMVGRAWIPRRLAGRSPSMFGYSLARYLPGALFAALC